MVHCHGDLGNFRSSLSRAGAKKLVDDVEPYVLAEERLSSDGKFDLVAPKNTFAIYIWQTIGTAINSFERSKMVKKC